MKPLNGYSLPLPPSKRQLPSNRQSPVRAVLARWRNASRKIQQPSSKRPLVRPQIYTDMRGILDILGKAARENKLVRITYRKATANQMLVSRLIEPYSLRYKMTAVRGRARYLYAHCSAGPTVGTHTFLVENIVSAEKTEETYTPKWRIEL